MAFKCVQAYSDDIVADDSSKLFLTRAVMYCGQCEEPVKRCNFTLDAGYSVKIRCDSCFKKYLSLCLAVNDTHFMKPGMKKSYFEIPSDNSNNIFISRRFIVYRDYDMTCSDYELDVPCRQKTEDMSAHNQ